MPTSGTPSTSHPVTMAASAPAAAARVVVTATLAKSAPTAASVEPALKPYQPNHRMNTPSAPRVSEWPGMARGLPLSSYLPIRGPMIETATSAATPPTRWTTPEPAKSRNPVVPKGSPSPVKGESHPFPQTQLVTIG